LNCSFLSRFPFISSGFAGTGSCMCPDLACGLWFNILDVYMRLLHICRLFHSVFHECHESHLNNPFPNNSSFILCWWQRMYGQKGSMTQKILSFCWVAVFPLSVFIFLFVLVQPSMIKLIWIATQKFKSWGHTYPRNQVIPRYFFPFFFFLWYVWFLKCTQKFFVLCIA
jgi:hypothetical protein